MKEVRFNPDEKGSDWLKEVRKEKEKKKEKEDFLAKGGETDARSL